MRDIKLGGQYNTNVIITSCLPVTVAWYMNRLRNQHVRYRLHSEEHKFYINMSDYFGRRHTTLH